MPSRKNDIYFSQFCSSVVAQYHWQSVLVTEGGDRQQVLEVDHEVPHGLGPLSPLVLLLQPGRVHVQVQDLVLLAVDGKGQLEILLVLALVNLSELQCQVQNLDEQGVQHIAEHLLVFPGAVPHRVVGFLAFHQDFGKGS